MWQQRTITEILHFGYNYQTYFQLNNGSQAATTTTEYYFFPTKYKIDSKFQQNSFSKITLKLIIVMITVGPQDIESYKKYV